MPLVGSAHGQDVVFGLMVVIVMLLLPQGFAGFLARVARLRARGPRPPARLNRESIFPINSDPDGVIIVEPGFASGVNTS